MEVVSKLKYRAVIKELLSGCDSRIFFNSLNLQVTNFPIATDIHLEMKVNFKTCLFFLKDLCHK